MTVPDTSSGPQLPQHRPTATTHLHGRWLLLARVGWWALTLLSLAFFVTGLPGRFPELTLYWFSSLGVPVPPAIVTEGLTHLGLTPGAYAGYALALTVATAAACYLVGALVFWRRYAERMALLVALFLVALPSSDTDPALLHAMAAEQPVRAAVGKVVETVGFTLLLWVFLLFPEGRFRPGWTRLVAAGWFLLGASAIFLPPGSPLDANTWGPALFAGFLLAALGVGVYAQVWRYRRVSGPVERQQAKWIALGLTALLGIFAAQMVLATVDALAWPAASPAQVVLTDLGLTTVNSLSFLAVPLTLAVAVLRYRLWEIDLIINRALVYGTLSAVLLAVYLGGVVLLQGLFRSLLGQENNLAIVVVTLISAGLFQPLRHHLQAAIDRRFYRRKYDAARTLAAFSAALRDEVDLATLSQELVRVVDETMQPSQVSLWLRTPGAADRSEDRR